MKKKYPESKKEEIKNWFKSNYKKEINFPILETHIREQRRKTTEELYKQDPNFRISWKPIELCYMDAIIEIYGEPNSK